jgi:starch synthase (maltosyl-transferring)
MSVERIIESLKNHRQELDTPYYIPGLWIDFESEPAEAVNPYDFYAGRLQDILDTSAKPLVKDSNGTDWTRYAITYNLFPRVTTAFDHNAQNGLEQVNSSGWRETGSFLKSIAILPYISSMSFNAVHLLPVTAIGHDGRKGTLGSPYAIQNPYRLDDNLCEPALPDIDAMTYFKAFVEVAHQLGLRVVMEFVLRTAARDSDWIKEHPHWF